MLHRPVKTIAIVSVATMLFALSCKAPEKRELHSNEFGWSITIPEGFDSVGAEDWKKMQERGADAVEETYGEEIDNQTTTLFVFKDGLTNYFEAGYQPFDESVDGSFEESWKGVNEILYQTFEAQIP